MAPRADGSTIRGLRPRSGDLIEDIHRQHRRRLLLRVAKVVGIAAVLGILVVVFVSLADGRSRGQALDAAQTHALAGGRADLAVAAQVLDGSLLEDPEHGPTLAARAIVAAVQVLEFGADIDEARRWAAQVPEDDANAELVAAFDAFLGGDREAAAAALQRVEEPEGLGADYVAYLRGWIALANASADPQQLTDAIGIVETELSGRPTHVALGRLLARLLVYAGRADEALPQLDKVRDLARTHMGLAADEALYNAHLGQEPGGVASVADQLLASGDATLGPRDIAHARLARAVVHVHSGERDQGLAQLRKAWPDLAQWDTLNRQLCVVTALEANAGAQAVAWAKEARLPAAEIAIYQAWATLQTGDVMTALSALADLPQEHPRVAYLQALALVEQGRYAEALPWIERTDQVLPGRIEIEVARARAELHTGNGTVALRKLEALANEEPYAPRAWTGLGQARLAQPDADLRAVQKAFQRAIDREPVPARAMQGLAHVWQRRAQADPSADSEAKALALLHKAAEENPNLPEYAEEYGAYLAALAFEPEALARLEPLVGHPATRGETYLLLARLKIDTGVTDETTIDKLLEEAGERGVSKPALDLLRARRLLAAGSREEVTQAQQMLAIRVAAVPEDIEARQLLAETYVRQHERKTAEQTVRRGLQTLPEDVKGRLYYSWADLEARIGQLRVAAPRSRTAFNRMLAENRPPRELLAAADLAATMWLRQHKDHIALQIVDRLTARLSQHPEAWAIAAHTQLRAGETADARTSAAKALALDEHCALAHSVMGTALLRQGKRDEAKVSYEAAIAAAKGTSEEGDYDSNLERL